MLEIKAEDFKIDTIGVAKLEASKVISHEVNFVLDSDQVVFPVHIKELKEYLDKGDSLPAMELAGPRSKLYFDPKKTKAGVITCGGLCPGLNSVIRAIVTTCCCFYGISEIYGYRNGFRGLNPAYKLNPILLTPDLVDNIHVEGGTILGSSRGEQNPKTMVDFLVDNKLNVLFVIGGDGTMRGAQKLIQEIEKRKLKIVVIGVPKTIDNDIDIIEKSFGFETAVEEATKAIYSAHMESKGSPNGVGLVKLMGRESGFIATAATLASAVVNYCLIPEVPFGLDGQKGFLKVLEKRLQDRKHAVIVVAEGAGQELIQGDKPAYDESGNVILKDIGSFLKQKIKEYFKKINMEVNVKYIDPSYMVRSVSPTGDDNVYCLMHGQNAVHAAMSGRTNMVIGYCNGHYVHLPMQLVVRGRKKVRPEGRIWKTVLDTTGQPAEIG